VVAVAEEVVVELMTQLLHPAEAEEVEAEVE
jgi:hypothetical protein